MHLELLIPGLCPPGGEPTQAVPRVDTPTLERWLSRSVREPTLPLAPSHWLWQRFTAASPEAGSDLPIAPVTLAVDGHAPGRRWWLRADPVHFVVGRTGLRLAPPDYLQLDAAESAALAASVRSHFSDVAADFLAPGPSRWYLGADRPFELETTAPADAAGADVDRHLPRGAGRRRWLGFVNEVQMLWYEHPVNRAREQRGAPTASGLWLHGAGQMPAPGQPGCDGVAGGGTTLAGLSVLAGCAWRELPVDAPAWLSGAAGERWLISLDGLLPPLQAGDASAWKATLDRMETDWFAPLDNALRTGHLSSILLRWPVAAGLATARIGAADRFRFWRRRLPLHLLLDIPDDRAHA